MGPRVSVIAAIPAPSDGRDRHSPGKRPKFSKTPRFSKTLSIFRVYPAAYHRVSWRVLVHYRGERPSFSILDRRNGEVARHCHRAVMSVAPGSIVHADAVRDVSLVLRGYTVSRHRRCLSLIAGNYVMRDSLRHCIRLPIDTVDPGTLAAAWADFGDSAKWSDPLYAGSQAGRQGIVPAFPPLRPAPRAGTSTAAVWPGIVRPPAGC
jgi:hypothetical protein